MGLEIKLLRVFDLLTNAPRLKSWHAQEADSMSCYKNRTRRASEHSDTEWLADLNDQRTPARDRVFAFRNEYISRLTVLCPRDTLPADFFREFVRFPRAKDKR